MPDDRPNILILMADQLKATALGLYGNRDVPTPNLERLAESGILYRRHYVAAAVVCSVESCLLDRHVPAQHWRGATTRS